MWTPSCWVGGFQPSRTRWLDTSRRERRRGAEGRGAPGPGATGEEGGEGVTGREEEVKEEVVVIRGRGGASEEGVWGWKRGGCGFWCSVSITCH